MVKAYGEAGVTRLLRDMLPWEVPLNQAYTIILHLCSDLKRARNMCLDGMHEPTNLPRPQASLRPAPIDKLAKFVRDWRPVEQSRPGRDLTPRTGWPAISPTATYDHR